MFAKFQHKAIVGCDYCFVKKYFVGKVSQPTFFDNCFGSQVTKTGSDKCNLWTPIKAVFTLLL